MSIAYSWGLGGTSLTPLTPVRFYEPIVCTTPVAATNRNPIAIELATLTKSRPQLDCSTLQHVTQETKEESSHVFPCLRSKVDIATIRHGQTVSFVTHLLVHSVM